MKYGWNDVNGDPYGIPWAICDVNEEEMIYMEMIKCEVCKMWIENCKCKIPKKDFQRTR